MSISAEKLRELVRYDPETGIFTWRQSQNGRAMLGSRAGSVSSAGYRRIGFDKVYYGEHRLAFLYMNGCWPLAHVDHRNGVRADNRWANLRPASREENAWNVGAHADNPFGVKGVHRLKSGRGWQANIVVNGVRRHLGTFASMEEAGTAYVEAAKAFHGSFARAA